MRSTTRRSRSPIDFAPMIAPACWASNHVPTGSAGDFSAQASRSSKRSDVCRKYRPSSWVATLSTDKLSRPRQVVLSRSSIHGLYPSHRPPTSEDVGIHLVQPARPTWLLGCTVSPMCQPSDVYWNFLVGASDGSRA